MPTEISAGVGDHPCSLTLYNYNPIDCKILIFPYTCSSAFLRDHHNYILVCTQLIISGKFSAHYKQSMAQKTSLQLIWPLRKIWNA